MKILILAGGKGTRLWPMSRENSPKQSQSLFGQQTLLQNTYQRIARGFKKSDIFISTNKQQLSHIKKQLPQVKPSQFIVEPMAKNTAAAIGLASAMLARSNSQEIIATVNSDHFIKDIKEYLRVIKLAGKVVKQHPGHLVLIGLNPTYPETGYGYIKLNKELAALGQDKIFTVDSFKEKPDFKTAKRYLRSWAYLWNPAYFVFQAGTMLDLFKDYLPGQYRILMKIKNSPDKLKSEFLKIKPISIDYGIMEKTKKLLCLPASFAWADIGHWRNVQEILSTGPDSNVVKGQHVHLDSHGNLIYSFSNKLVATIGVSNSIIVETADAILICPKDRAQDVKDLVALFKKQGLDSYL